MKTDDGREVSATVLVLCDGPIPGRDGTGGYLRRRVVELGGVALRAEGDAPGVLRIARSTMVDLVVVGGATKTDAERDVIEGCRSHVPVFTGVESLDAWFPRSLSGAFLRALSSSASRAR